MKALTLRQPWASLVVAGLKDVENRTWAWHMPTRAPGEVIPQRLAIHAGKRRDIDGWLALAEDEKDAVAGKGGLLPDLPCGVLLGTVLVTGCHHADECHETHSDLLERPAWCSPWADTRGWHWLLADPVEFAEPIPMRGRQRLWTVPDDAIPDRQKG